jgi:hypothetical protein
MNQPASLQAIDQLDRAVMLDLQPLGQRPNGCSLPAAQALHRQKRLMLLWLQTCGTRCPFAEIQESPDLVAKFSQSLNVIGGALELFHGHHQLYRITM